MPGTSARGAAAMLAIGALAAGVAGVPAARADHCQPITIFSGHSVEGESGPKTNPGSGGCALAQHDANRDTNFLVPGANALSVGVVADPAGVARPGEEETALVRKGRVTYTYRDAEGTEITAATRLTLTWSGTRWDSQEIAVDGTLVRATAQVRTQPGAVVRVTYRELGGES